MNTLPVDFPKTDIHKHTDVFPRLDRLMAGRTGRQPYDWHDWLQRVYELPPGMPRLNWLNGELPYRNANLLKHESPYLVAWLTEALEEEAQDGALLVEIRGWQRRIHILQQGFMTLFREAEQRVRERRPDFFAEAIVCMWPSQPDELKVFDACLRAREEGLSGIDFIPNPYDSEADWTEAYRWAEIAAEAGLSITAHVGEFSSANVAASLRMPGLTRIGHGVHAAYDPELLEQVAEAGVTVECCLTSNVVLGAVSSLEMHPIKKFVEAGIPVTLNTDHTLQMLNSIGREYEQAVRLGFSRDELLSFTRQGILASFTSQERKKVLLDNLQDRISLDVI
jgi:adenosine deaminase